MGQLVRRERQKNDLRPRNELKRRESTSGSKKNGKKKCGCNAKDCRDLKKRACREKRSSVRGTNDKHEVNITTYTQFSLSLSLSLSRSLSLSLWKKCFVVLLFDGCFVV